MATRGEEPNQANQPAVRAWKYGKIVRPVPAAAKYSDWVRNPIDAFVLAKLQSEGLEPAPPAHRETLVRRVYYDLIGLPPTPEQVQEFLMDQSPDAYERLIDRLLESPHYGERWGRHWLDVVRFAETNGYERDGPKPNAWRYRDYVIRSFNDDKPYDRFILEQLAGDELDAVTNETRIALGFNRLGPWDDEPADPLMYRFELLDDSVRATSNVFLGMTINCARCHDHKFDPITQRDYYRLLAFFAPSKHVDDLPLASEQERAEFAAQNAELDANVKVVEEEINKLIEPTKRRLIEEKRSKLGAEVLEALDTPPESRTEEQKALAANNTKVLEVKPDEISKALGDEEKKAKQELDQKVKDLNAGRPTPLPAAIGILDSDPNPPKTHLLKRGDARTPGEEVEPGYVSVLSSESPQIHPPRPDTTGRRLALARWISSPDNPMTARVMVNRIWQHHFGEGLVRTTNDFGSMGESPSHSELLDWLATEFMNPASQPSPPRGEGANEDPSPLERDGVKKEPSPLGGEGRVRGWSIKHLHRLILLSNTYRMSSQWNDQAAARDPDNRLLWRFSYRRLEAEPIRDAVLAVSGQLNLEMAGPSIYPKIDPGILAGQSRPGQGWGTSDKKSASRRSVYIFVKRSVRVPLMEVLDAADSNEPCPRRNTSTVAPQALTLLNSEFMNQQAAHFADRLIQECDRDPAKQIERAYRLALSRPPRIEELQAGLDFLGNQRAGIIAKNPPGSTALDQPTRDPNRDSLAAFCLVVLNLNEFVYVD